MGGVFHSQIFIAMPRVKQFDEKAVLVKAMELFWKTGYNGTSIQNLVDYLGINRASLYDTFGGKDTLFEKAFALYLEENGRQIRAVLNQEVSIRAGLQKLFELSVEQSVRDPEKKGCFVVNTTTELIPNNDGAWVDTLNRNRLHFEQIFREYLERGVQQGEISPEKDLPGIAAYLFTIYNGLKVIAKINPSKKDLLRIVETAMQVLD